MLLACFAACITSYQSNSRARRSFSHPLPWSNSPLEFKSDHVPVCQSHTMVIDPCKIFRVTDTRSIDWRTEAREDFSLRHRTENITIAFTIGVKYDQVFIAYALAIARSCSLSIIHAFFVGRSQLKRSPFVQLANLYVTSAEPKERGIARERERERESDGVSGKMNHRLHLRDRPRERWLPQLPTLNK